MFSSDWKKKQLEMSGVAAQLVRDTGDHTEKKKEKKKLQMAENYTIKSIQNKHMYMVY